MIRKFIVNRIYDLASALCNLADALAGAEDEIWRERMWTTYEDRLLFDEADRLRADDDDDDDDDEAWARRNPEWVDTGEKLLAPMPLVAQTLGEAMQEDAVKAAESHAEHLVWPESTGQCESVRPTTGEQCIKPLGHGPGDLHEDDLGWWE